MLLSGLAGLGAFADSDREVARVFRGPPPPSRTPALEAGASSAGGPAAPTPAFATSKRMRADPFAFGTSPPRSALRGAAGDLERDAPQSPPSKRPRVAFRDEVDGAPPLASAGESGGDERASQPADANAGGAAAIAQSLSQPQLPQPPQHAPAPLDKTQAPAGVEAVKPASLSPSPPPPRPQTPPPAPVQTRVPRLRESPRNRKRAPASASAGSPRFTHPALLQRQQLSLWLGDALRRAAVAAPPAASQPPPAPAFARRPLPEAPSVRLAAQGALAPRDLPKSPMSRRAAQMLAASRASAPLLHGSRPKNLLFTQQAASLHTLNANERWCLNQHYDTDEVAVRARTVRDSGGGSVEVLLEDAASKRQLGRTLNLEPKATKFQSVTIKGLQGKDFCLVLRLKSRLTKQRVEYHVRRPSQGKLLPPVYSTLGPVCGLTDLHVHQFATLGFDRIFLDVPYDGPLPPLDRMRRSLFFGALQFEQRAHAVHLKEAFKRGLRLVVVPVVSNEMFCILPWHGKGNCGDMFAARLQLRAAREFARKHSDWHEIALDPWEARRIIHQGKLAVVLSLEVSDVLPEDLSDWREQLDELYDMGLRVMFISHGIDNRFAGAAPQDRIYMVQRFLQRMPSSIVNLIKSKTVYPVGRDGLHTVGITPLGEKLVKEIMDRNMLLDIGHLTRKGRREAARLTADLRYPLISSHCRYVEMLSEERKKKYREFPCSDEELIDIRDRHGVVGLRIGSDVVLTYKKKKPTDPEPVCNDCGGSSTAIAQQYLYGVALGVNQATGADYNGFSSILTPRYGPHACAGSDVTNQHREAMARGQPKILRLGTPFDTFAARNISTLLDLLRDLRQLGVNISNIASSAEHFLRAWELAYPSAPAENRNLGKPLLAECEEMFDPQPQAASQKQKKKKLPVFEVVAPSPPAGSDQDATKLALIPDDATDE